MNQEKDSKNQITRFLSRKLFRVRKVVNSAHIVSDIASNMMNALTVRFLPSPGHSLLDVKIKLLLISIPDWDHPQCDIEVIRILQTLFFAIENT